MTTAKAQDKTTENPFFSPYRTPFEVPDFKKIKPEHYQPAYEKGMVEQRAAIEKIVSNKEKPTFKNTIEALENSGVLLNKVENVFSNQTSANTNKELQEIAKNLSPIMSKHSDDIMLNAKLFEQIKSVYKDRNNLAPDANDKNKTFNLNLEQKKLVEEIYKSFVRSGANVTENKKEELRAINKELSLLALQFGENTLKGDNNWKHFIASEKELAGIPQSIKDAMALDAKNAGQEGKWLVTLHKSSWIPVLQYAQNRALREKVYTAWMNRGNTGDEFDNNSNAAKIASLRVKKANLLGYKTWADYILEDNMAKTPEAANELLMNLWNRSLPIAKQEVAEMQKMIDAEGGNFKLTSWDWWYYSEKVRKAKYDLDEEELRPYFELNNVRKGLFEVIGNLYHIKFIERKDIPTPHPDALAFEVQESNGKHIGILFMDFHPRDSKRSGAWMSSYRKQSYKEGEMVTPIITNVLNFTKPTADKPALLTFEEVETMYHEIGHGLHGLLSNSTYNKLSGTAVPRDFVELPSQVMEHWAGEPEVLKMYAKHYITGEVIPDALMKKLQDSRKFNQGFMTTEYLAAAILDLKWHTLTTSELQNPADFEKKAMDEIGLIDEILPRYKSGYFNHIFSGGYSAGYYAYIWAAVLDADAFQAFKETGDIFNPEKAKLFREQVLSKGGTDDPMILYKNFRGQEPTIDALLENRGLN
ncbi:MAG: peptidase M3 [Flavobacteriales bacterium CG_4_9_14_3_um_filter_32_8]|nr:MAG: peptidase M3 [Flavobacteriales bacterium CG_4_9_14_3_um_filter_32_8]